jgi:predicted nucleotidyltransferase
MKRETVLQILLAHEKDLRVQYGVKSLSLFGSVARDAATESSDVDLLVDFNRPTGYFGVDLGTACSIKPRLRERILQECIHVA